MFDILSIIPAMSYDAFVSAYWICLITGGGLLVISTLSGASHLGSADVDVDFDIDADVDFDADFDVDMDIPDDFDVDITHAHEAVGAAEHLAAADSAISLSSWFSLRFVVFATATFGFLGVALTYLSDLTDPATAGIAIIGGIAVGQIVHQIIRKIRRNSGNSAPMPSDYLKKSVRVTMVIEHPNKGEVALKLRNAERFIPAVTRRPQTSFKVGDQAFIIAYRGGVAEVVSKKEFDFITYKGTGGSS
jgi:hypothetical protein